MEIFRVQGTGVFDLAALASAIAAHGPVARVVIAAHDGSSPREVGAAMLVWATGQDSTIGGGALEWEALAQARAMLAGGAGGPRLDRQALGPKLGQCCGGAVTVLTEVYSAEPEGPVVARSVDGRAMPLAVKRMLARARGEGVMPSPVLVQGWFVEPVAQPQRHVWVWGAGHVGRAVVAVLAPLPGVAVTWVDVDATRFPDVVPDGVRIIAHGDVAGAVADAPSTAEHLVMTFSHALDLDLCHRLLGHGFRRLGLIGSATKWARFRSRLAALGHAPLAIAQIDCPIGNPALGKHPQAIAIGVAAGFLGQAAMKGIMAHG
ncbi:MAG: xanthine dehydrogenase accessory protein XdhC [Pseudomonadota bacterium]|jgi:xanthine dehydrogenase accessory factor